MSRNCRTIIKSVLQSTTRWFDRTIYYKRKARQSIRMNSIPLFPILFKISQLANFSEFRELCHGTQECKSLLAINLTGWLRAISKLALIVNGSLHIIVVILETPKLLLCLGEPASSTISLYIFTFLYRICWRNAPILFPYAFPFSFPLARDSIWHQSRDRWISCQKRPILCLVCAGRRSTISHICKRRNRR